MNICKAVSVNQLLILYGILVMGIALKNLIVTKQIRLNKWLLMLGLIFAGVIHGMFVSGGALLVIYATKVLTDKEEFRATIAPVWIVLNTYMLVCYARESLITPEVIHLSLVSIVPLLVAIYLGNLLQKRMDQRRFLRLTNVLLIISGLSLVI